jgi:hypothetical protein
VLIGGLLALTVFTLLLSQAATPARLSAGRALQGLAMAALLKARRQGQLPETEADYDVAQTRKHQTKPG